MNWRVLNIRHLITIAIGPSLYRCYHGKCHSVIVIKSAVVDCNWLLRLYDEAWRTVSRMGSVTYDERADCHVAPFVYLIRNGVMHTNHDAQRFTDALARLFLELIHYVHKNT